MDNEKELIEDKVIDEKGNEKKDDTIEKELLSLQDVVYKRRWVRTVIIFIIVTIICIAASKMYANKIGLGTTYPYQIGDSKITQKQFDGINNIVNDKEQTIYLIADTLILSDLAKERGFTVTQDEINKVEYPYFKEQFALSQKIQDDAKDKIDNVTDEELRKFYEENKDLFAKEGTVKIIPIQAKESLTSTEKIDTSKYSSIDEKLSTLLKQGFTNSDITAGKNILLEYDQNSGLYRYLFFIDKNITDYYTYEECLNDIKREYNCAYGTLSLNEYVSNAEETVTIKSSEPLNTNTKPSTTDNTNNSDTSHNSSTENENK